MLLGESLAVLAVICLPPIFAIAIGAQVDAAASVLRVLAAILAVLAGSACLTSWRLQGLAFPGLFGTALIGLGTLRVAQYILPGPGQSPLSSARSVDSLVVASVFTVLAWKAVSAEEVDSRIAPFRSGGCWLTAGLSVIGLVHVLAAHHVAADRFSTTTQRLLLLVAALTILTVGGTAVYRAKARAVVPAWSALSIMVLALGSSLRATWPTASSWDLAAAAVSGLACAMVMTASVGDLQIVLVALDRSSLRLRSALASTEEQLRAEQAVLEERLHDLRNATMGLASAHSALRQHGDLLQEEARSRLADAVTSELARMQSLVEPQLPRQSVDFSVATVLQPVIEIARACGMILDVQLAGTVAHGHPAGFAQVVQNLLVNARKYAPGTAVQLRTTQIGGRVQVRVTDQGPGIARDEQLRIFARGSRGRQAAGTDGEGLGLHVAAGLMSAMGGSLRLVDAQGPGACFLLELRPARESDGSAEPEASCVAS